MSDTAMAPARLHAPSTAARRTAGLYRVELALTLAILGLLLACVLRERSGSAMVEWPRFLPALSAALGLVGLGGFIRARRDLPRLAVFAIALGIFTGFSAAVAIFIFQMFPFQNPMIDPTLSAVDARLGYDWPAFVRLVADWPVFGRLLGLVYGAAIPQLVLVIAALAWAGRDRALHRFLTVGLLGMAVTVAIWHVWPSLGPSVLTEVPAEAARIGLVVDAAYAERLLTYARDGVAVIRPEIMLGVIAFPSFHMFMALMAVIYARGTLLFWPMLAVNLLMVPATLSHGGHHLIDLIGALVLFGALAAAAGRLLPDPATKSQ